MSNQQYCTFMLDGYFFGVEVERVQEVIRYQEMTAIPLAHPVIRGLINLRGHIVTAMDLRKRLGLNPAPEGSGNPMNVVVRTNESPVSLLVDKIGDVLEVDDEAFEDPPATLIGEARSMVKGAYKLKDKLLLILNADEALNLPVSVKSAAN